MREILTDITTPSGIGKVSVMYFDQTGTAASQTAAVRAFWDAIKGLISTGTTFQVRGTGRELAAGSGNLTGIWTATTPAVVAGTNVGEELPDVSQALVQWRTLDIRNGRFIRGRTFIPSLATGNMTNGNLSSGALGTLNSASSTFATSGFGLVVWSRPSAAGPGEEAPVTSATVWNELAVLRRRRG